MVSTSGTVDEYIAALPDDVRVIMRGIRRTIRDAAPGVEERISYAMPTFVLDGLPLVHVAAWKKHIGIYPLPELEGSLAAEVAPYRGAKDAMQLPLREPIPYGLVGRVVAVLVERRAAGL
ncbi:hypothetical protein E4P39_02765 [Blastococcus sp. CT_GayMR19]|uniref:iron chaperone n=1 Tax=Blastococcus sp. CT_GayMR19 TaxID=2559608 RepID=UPI0010748027|nr:DUF1801 domain-containing protein [Blastococcus sp. CT_GayMR19]TFV78181.1 hypothetical protein E4P39_02765 [Blastococcus sp. CT_GayMR19]